MNKQVKKHLPEIIKVLNGERVILALLFGSGVSRKQTGLSDLDFAVLLPESVSEKNRQLTEANRTYYNTFI